VLVQGTDTLEESAYLLDLYWDRSEPLVLTGAMRPPDAAGADGPGNLLAAVTAAASPALRETGAVVVLNDEVHRAACVRKTHSTALNAFCSPVSGPLAVFEEGVCVLVGRPDRTRCLPEPERPPQVRVALLEATLDDDGDLVRVAADRGYDGVVVAAFGVGHLSAAAAEAVSDALRRVPVVVATRTGAGSTATRTYGFPGSESDLLRRGAVLAGRLDPRKARILLWALLRSGADREEVRREFERRGGGVAQLPADR
jgi:L-asparaginase